MLPIGLLMKEHRLTEDMMELVVAEKERVRTSGRIDLSFIGKMVDFIRVYVDQCHHGKEEDILFAALKNKKIAAEHRKIMEELIEEHKQARSVIGSIVATAGNDNLPESKKAGDIAGAMECLTGLYARHIVKEDRDFFLPVMEYFDDREKDAMLKACYDFDMAMIHKKYKAVIDGLAGERK